MTDDLMKRVAAEAGFSSEKCQSIFNAFKATLLANAEDLNSVSIPGFATFATEKLDERVVEDPSSGRRMLLPPAIEMQIKSSVVLRKKILG